MSDFQLAEVTAGSVAVDTVRLLRAATLTGTPTLDATQVTNPVNYTDLVFTDGWATIAWTRSDYWYWVEAVDVEGRATRSLPIWGGDQAEFELTVGGRVDEQWQTRPVSVTLLDVAEVGGQQYLTKTYSGTVAADGSWSVPGLPAASIQAAFTFPDQSRVIRTLPTTAGTHDFSSLSA